MQNSSQQPMKRLLIDLPLWVINAIQQECDQRKEDGKPITKPKPYIETICIAHVQQTLLPKQDKKAKK